MPTTPGLAGQIDTYLKQKGSPLAGLGNVFVASGKKYGIDPRLIVGIAGAESTFGKYLLSANNAWNWDPGKPFSSWQEGINTVTQGMAYYRDHRHATTPAQIVTHYAPASDGNDESVWTNNVSTFMRELGATPASTTTKTVVTPPPPAKHPEPVLLKKPPASKAVPTTATEATVAATRSPFKLPALPTFQPSDAGLRGALISNLLQTAQYGHAPSGASLLSDVLGGQLQDQQTDDTNQQLLDAYTAAIKSAIPPPLPAAAPVTPTPAAPPLAPPPLLTVPPPTAPPPPASSTDTTTPDPNASMPADKVHYWAHIASGADRSGVATVPGVFDIVARIAQAHGSPLTITTGSNHHEYVSGSDPPRQSAHWTGHAADIVYGHGTGSDNVDPALTRLGQIALMVAGMPRAEALKQQGGWFNVGNYNILFNTYVGGNHYNHLHVGLRS